MKIAYQEIAGLPKLGWVAAVDSSRGEVSVLHGRAVECRDDWLVEGVWDGPFEEGDFHRSEHLFGTGLRVEGERVYGVASYASVDRLIYCVVRGSLLISNSVILLAGLTGARLDPHHDYTEETNASIGGITRYRREYRVVHPEIEAFYQVYHENLVWEHGDLRFEMRSEPREIQSYEEYDRLLQASMEAIRANYASPARSIPLKAFITLSSGYDSTAVAALARRIGVRTCFVSRRSNSSIPPWLSRSFSLDDGSPTARALGLDIMELDHRRRSISTDELYFLASTVAEPELAFHTMARHIERTCAAAIVFTGHWGGQIWGLEKCHTLGDALKRGDSGGLSLAEIRLKSGFIHVAPAFLYGRSAPSICRIAHSPEMEPWRLHTSYDKPLARRIAESAGVPRQAFGMKKKAVMRYYDLPMNAALRKQFLDFLRRTHGVGAWSFRASLGWRTLRYRLARVRDYVRHACRRGAKLSDPMFAHNVVTPEPTSRRQLNTPYLMHLWAFDLLTRAAERLFETHSTMPSRDQWLEDPAAR